MTPGEDPSPEGNQIMGLATQSDFLSLKLEAQIIYSENDEQ